MDKTLEMVNVDPLAIGMTHRSKDEVAEATSFGHHLLELGSWHQMIIYNGLAKWSGLEELTCLPHGGGESIVDYLIGRPEATHMINSFRVAPCPIGAYHSFLYFELKCDTSNATNFSKPNHHNTFHAWAPWHLLPTCSSPSMLSWFFPTFKEPHYWTHTHPLLNG